MRARWTVDDVNKMAPDATSVAAGRKLAHARQWKLLGASDTHVWGELQGSGAKPYQTCIERAEPAFHCSCPSRKFPCKHGLALAFIEAEHPDALTAHEAPAWVEEWVRKRAERDQRKQARSEAASQPPDADTAERRAKDQARRAQARMDKAREGMAFVSQWLRDTVRQGVATQAEQPYRHWDELAARTVDAQIPGLARHFRQLPALRHARADWQTPFLDSLARLHLLGSAFQRMEALTPAWRADLEAALGFAQDRDALLASAGISDRWCVLGAIDGEDDGLRHQRTWLHGERSGRSALLLDFAARAQVLPAYGPAGSCFDGELVFYPGAWPQRALLKQRGETQAGRQLIGALSSVSAALDQFVQAASQLPWLERIGLTLQAVTPLYRDQAWSVVDASGAMLPLCADTTNAWELLAVSGGQQLTVFGEFDGECLLPLSVADVSGVQALPAGLTRVGGLGAMAQLPAWRAATTAALLGAERQQQALSAPGPLGETLARLYPQAALPASAEQRSAALLDALAVLSLYRRGARPPAEVAALPAACETDDWPAAGAQAASQLRQIIEDEGAELLHEWLAVAAQARRRCPELLLPRLLERLARSRSPMPAQSSVLGGRGRWLALQHEGWRALLTQAANDAASDEAERPWAAQWLAHWEEGSTAQRCAALQALRQREPQAAQQRLAVVFAAEPAAVRAALLDTLATGLGPADEAWLEACLTDKSQEVRQRAAALLSRLPDSGFGQRVEARAQTWVQFKPRTGLLSRIAGSKGELAVLLPEAWDAAWTRDGLIEKPPRGQGAKAWWLAQTLALVPPSSWARQWGLTPADCLSLLDGHEWREPLRTGWLQATLTQADADWAAAWLAAPAALADGSERAPLWRLLPPTQRAERLLQALAQARGAALRDLLQLLPELDLAWDDAISGAVIEAWRRLVGALDANAIYGVYPLLREAALRLTPQRLPQFEQAFARELAQEGPWHKILSETRDRLRFRHAMHAALKEGV